MAENLAEAIIEDLVNMSVATSETSNSLRSLDGKTIIELEQEDEVIEVYENGELLLEVELADEKFNEKLIGSLATSLNF